MRSGGSVDMTAVAAAAATTHNPLSSMAVQCFRQDSATAFGNPATAAAAAAASQPNPFFYGPNHFSLSQLVGFTFFLKIIERNLPRSVLFRSFYHFEYRNSFSSLPQNLPLFPPSPSLNVCH